MYEFEAGLSVQFITPIHTMYQWVILLGNNNVLQDTRKESFLSYHNRVVLVASNT